jgi:hypothetical protein
MNAPFKLPVNRVPDLYLSGETVEQMLLALNNAIIFAKVQDGAMRPFVDPTPLIQILQAAIQAANNPETQQ